MFRKRLQPVLQDYIKVSACFLPVIPVIRILEYFTLKGEHPLPEGSAGLIFSGLPADLSAFLTLCLAAAIPFIVLGLLSRKAASIAWLVFLILFSFFEYALIRYFSATLVPLDQVVFSYTMKEMITISASSTTFSLMTFLPFVILLALILLSYFLLRKTKPGNLPVALSLFLFILSPFLMWGLNPRPQSYEKDLQYFMAVNKPAYLAQKCYQYLQGGRQDPFMTGTPDKAMVEQFALYQENHPEFRFAGPTFPLLHKEETPDVLGPYFNAGTRKPNLVFIIVESLSSAFCGENPYLGSFTPFLDSLAQNGLSWSNCLSSSERTFWVLPSLFGSLPFGSGMFLDNLTRKAYHLSLIWYLNENGYTTRFFYGGDPQFNQMDNFLNRNRISYIMTTWGPGYNAQEKAEYGFKWGYPDHEMFRRSFEILDSLDVSPRMDIYLTLSMHAPFVPPERKKYAALFARRLSELNLPEAGRSEYMQYQDIYSTILYTDDALRSFFREYSKRPEFGNTIFFITGDHSLPELNTGWRSPMERFRVPFIIWSPMLKSCRSFPPVITHNDVTPSVLAFLKNRYDIELNDLSHWIGPGLDTSAAFRCERSIVFIRNNKEMVDYVDGNHCLSDGRLYRITPDMTAVPADEPAVKERLQKKLDNTVTVTEYVGAANLMIPPAMLFGKSITGEPIMIPDGIMFPEEPVSGEFVTVVDDLPFREEIKSLRVEISFGFRTDETDLSKIPRIVFDIVDSAGIHRIWNQFPLFPDKGFQPGRWQAVSFSGNMDLNSVRDIRACRLKMYLWNPSLVQVQCRDLERKLTAYK